MWCALASFVLARRSGGRFALRIEDIDGPRIVAGSEARILQDLRTLGLSWDEHPGGPHAPYTQSARAPLYEAVLEELERRGLTYPCDCSRAEIARVASAPHGEEVIYPGICRDKPRARSMKRSPALRLRVASGTSVRFVDLARAEVTQRVDTAVGDFVLRRGDGLFAYQLACAVDDAAMEIDVVIRGSDLLASTPRQLLLLELLGAEARPSYLHLPLVVTPGGERLAKRTRGTTIRELLALGVSSEEILGGLAYGLGLATSPAPASAEELSRPELGVPARWPVEPFLVPRAWLSP